MRGLRNPQELAFDDDGNLFACDNDSDQGDRERLVQVLEGGDSGWRVGYQHSPQPAERNPWLAEHQWEPRDPAKNQPARILSPLANMPDGPSGLVHYPGTGLPDKYKGCFLLACYNGSSTTSQVVVFRPKPDGASFQLEFLESFLPGCQATDVDFGPDSRLYVSFWDEGWARTAQGRIMRVEEPEARKAQAAQIADVQRMLGEGMKDRTVAALVKLLGFADQRVRLEAQWEIADRIIHGDAADEGLTGLRNVIFNSKARHPRLHAIQALGHVVRLAHQKQLAENSGFVMQAPEDLAWTALFNDSDEEIRVACLKIIAQQPAPLDASLDAIVRRKLTDASPRVRLAAAQAAGRHGGVKSVGALLNLARADAAKSEALRHATAYALAQIASRIPDAWTRLELAAWDTDPHVRLTVLLAFGMSGPEAAQPIGNFLLDADPAMVREAIGLLSDRGMENADDGKLAGKISLFAGKSGDPMMQLRGLNALFRSGGQQNANRLMSRITDHENPLSAALWVEALQMLAQWEHPAPRDRVVGIFRPLPEGTRTREEASTAFSKLTPDVWESDPQVTLQALETAGALQFTDWSALCAGYASDGAQPQAVRLKALQVLAGFNGPQLPETLKTLITDKNSVVRIAAAGLIGKTDPALAAKGLSESLADGTVASSRAVFTALASLHAPETDLILAGQLNLLTEGKVPAPARLELLEAALKSAGPAVKEALAKYQTSLPKDDLLAPFYAALEGGDAVAGRTIFREHVVAACLRCHQIEGSGGEAGPSLDGLAARMDRRTILESIIEPNAKIAEGFQMTVFTLKDGTALAGAVKSETESTVVLQVPGSEPVTLEKSRIDRHDNVPSGMMPGLGLLLTHRQLRDIVEYCASLAPAK